MKTAEELAKFMHDLYEMYAVKWGWKTQAQCQVRFEDLPETNKRTMIAVAEHLLEEQESYAKQHAIEFEEYCIRYFDMEKETEEMYDEWINTTKE